MSEKIGLYQGMFFSAYRNHINSCTFNGHLQPFVIFHLYIFQPSTDHSFDPDPSTSQLPNLTEPTETITSQTDTELPSINIVCFKTFCLTYLLNYLNACKVFLKDDLYVPLTCFFSNFLLCQGFTCFHQLVAFPSLKINRIFCLSFKLARRPRLRPRRAQRTARLLIHGWTNSVSILFALSVAFSPCQQLRSFLDIASNILGLCPTYGCHEKRL